MNADNFSGIVIAHYSKQVEVEVISGPDQGKTIRCNVRPNLDNLVTGDNILFQGGDPDGIITSRQERRSEIFRPDKYNKLKPVAANIDRIVIVISPEPPPSADFLDRYLVAAEASNIQPIIVLNKADLIKDINSFLKTNNLEIHQKLGYNFLCLSSTHPETSYPDTTNSLRKLLMEKNSVLVGQSGVGKSSLINAMLPDADSRTGELASSGTGSHTTTTARLYSLPEGGRIIDSPGIRDFNLWHIDPDSLADFFTEFRTWLGKCKFRNCSHQSEPACAIKQAVSNGDISQQRYDSFIAIKHSLEQEG